LTNGFRTIQPQGSVCCLGVTLLAVTRPKTTNAPILLLEIDSYLPS
jgi:hypothetical protein